MVIQTLEFILGFTTAITTLVCSLVMYKAIGDLLKHE